MNSRGILVFIILLIIMVADAGLVSIADGALLAILFSVMFRQFAVYILLLLGALQDTPGLAGAWWYVGFVCVGCIVIVQSLLVHRKQFSERWTAEFTMMFVAVSLAGYGLLISLFSQQWLGLEQSADRPFLVVGGLIAFNVICAYHSFRLLYSDVQATSLLRMALSLILAHMVIVAMIQAVIDPSFLASAVSSDAFEGSGQLATVTSLGYARVTGTYATPNGFALVTVFLLLVWLSTYNRQRVPFVFTVCFVVACIGVSVLSLSKAMLAFSMLCSAIVLVSVGLKGLISRGVALVLVVTGLLLLSDIVLSDAVLDAFRFDALDFDVDTYRNIAWRAVFHGFTLENWLLGTGLSYWPTYFDQTVGFELSDPHTWVFSYAGTFGILGVVFFAYVIWRMLSSYTSHSAVGKALMLCMLVLLLVKDAVSIPYLLGNTPLTWFIWVLLFYVCASDTSIEHVTRAQKRARRRTRKALASAESGARSGVST